MQNNPENLRQFLISYKDILNIKGITDKLQLPEKCLSNFMLGKPLYAISEEQQKELLDYFANFGYNAYETEQQKAQLQKEIETLLHQKQELQQEITTIVNKLQEVKMELQKLIK